MRNECKNCGLNESCSGRKMKEQDWEGCSGWVSFGCLWVYGEEAL